MSTKGLWNILGFLGWQPKHMSEPTEKDKSAAIRDLLTGVKCHCIRNNGYTKIISIEEKVFPYREWKFNHNIFCVNWLKLGSKYGGYVKQNL